jgi:AcrR family transcriptional regulator
MLLRRRAAGHDPAPVTPPVRAPNLLAGERLSAKPRQRRSVAKRTRLEAAALALFRDRGYDGTSVDAIARRARLAVGSFYQHYESKRQLLVALMQELVERLDRLALAPVGAGDIHNGLHELIAHAFASDFEYLGAYRAWQEAVLSDAELAKKERAIREWTHSRVAGMLDKLLQLPGARRGVNVTALARSMDGLFWTMIADAARAPDANLDEAIDAATHLLYHALFIDAIPPAPTARNRR